MSNDSHLPGYTIRRPVPARSLLPAVGVGVAVGLAAFYVVRVLLERQPVLSDEDRELRARALERRSGRRVSTLGGEMVGGLDDLEADERIESGWDEHDKTAVESGEAPVDDEPPRHRGARGRARA
jgi:hypothetical protein